MSPRGGGGGRAPGRPPLPRRREGGEEGRVGGPPSWKSVYIADGTRAGSVVTGCEGAWDQLRAKFFGKKTTSCVFRPFPRIQRVSRLARSRLDGKELGGGT